MGDGDIELAVSFPLDGDGFLRRECPTCERELKWLNSAEGEAEPVPDGGMFCPYCAIQASGGWETKPQGELIEATALREVVGPEIEKLKRSLGDLGGGVSASVDADLPDQPDPLTEGDDMRRVDFSCHPREPVKVLDDWQRPVHCLICGTASA